MCASAASTPSTTATDRIASSHSVSKSASVAGSEVGHDVARRGIGAEVAAERAQIGDDRRQQRGRDRAVDQQRLGGAADAGAPHLGIRHDAAGHRVIGGGVHVGVAKPLGMREHRHARLALHALDQRLAAARHDQVEQAGGGQHRGDIGAVGIRRDLHAGFRQSRRAQSGDQRRVDRRGAAHAFRTAAQDHRVARLQADAGGIGADIGAALVDHADHADRRGDALDAQTVRPRPVGERTAERIGQLRDVLQARWPWHRRALRSARAGRGTRRCRCRRRGRRRWRPGSSAVCDAQGRRHRTQRRIAFGVRRARQNMRGGARGLRRRVADAGWLRFRCASPTFL